MLATETAFTDPAGNGGQGVMTAPGGAQNGGWDTIEDDDPYIPQVPGDSDDPGDPDDPDDPDDSGFGG